MRTLKLVVAYDGTQFFGWQFQPDCRTVQGTLEQAIQEITGETLRVTGSGRTDAGVHALGQIASFRTASPMPVEVFRRALNAHLPDDVKALSVEEMPESFHAIRSSVRKRYRYRIDNGRVPDVFARAFAWHVPRPLEVARMQAAAQYLLGTHDFRSFQTAGSARETTIRTVFDLVIQRMPDERSQRIELEIEADGFLYNMVRTIVGSLVKVGQGARPVDWMAEVLAARDRRVAGPNAPPQGLYLLRVMLREEPNS